MEAASPRVHRPYLTNKEYTSSTNNNTGSSGGGIFDSPNNSASVSPTAAQNQLSRGSPSRGYTYYPHSNSTSYSAGSSPTYRSPPTPAHFSPRYYTGSGSNSPDPQQSRYSASGTPPSQLAGYPTAQFNSHSTNNNINNIQASGSPIMQSSGSKEADHSIAGTSTPSGNTGISAAVRHRGGGAVGTGGELSSAEQDHYRKASDSKEDNHARALNRAADRPKQRSKFALYNYFDDLFPEDDVKVFLVICFASFFTRFFAIHFPRSIVWDETHFGKFAGYYIKGTFYFDVHPPLAKMLIFFAGWITGYDGNFAFEKPGIPYDGVRYMGMRLMCAFFGACVPPLSFMTVRGMGFSIAAASLSACFCLFDVGSLCLARFILLDPFLMFFIQLSVFCTVMFFSVRRQPFSDIWWMWLAASGISLGLTLSVKWVGLFVILFVGATTAMDLWDLLGDLKLNNKTLVKHLMARVACLIILPILVYTFTFWLHFALLPRTGPGDGFMSSAFQTKLEGNELQSAQAPLEVAYGSIVSLKSQRIGGALLHSHEHLYPDDVGPRQQQITCYAHKDSNNHFMFLKAKEEYDSEAPIEYIRHGDVVRLRHVNTGRHLHSHKEKAPLTKKHFQVSGYGDKTIGDSNDYWVVDFVGGKANETLRVLHSSFRLLHQNVKCALYTHGENLPKWGYEQNEVTCNPDSGKTINNNLWNVEHHENNRLSAGERYSDSAPGLMRSMLELHYAMFSVNNNLKPKPDEVTSRPWQWPIDYKGQRFTGWAETDVRVYLIGNPLVFLGGLVAIGIFLVLIIVQKVKEQRGIPDAPWNREKKRLTQNTCCWLLFGWCLHYFPFFLMGRVLYFHHYFPCMLFANMLMAVLLDYFIHRLRLATLTGVVDASIVNALHIVLFLSFLVLCPVAYGMTGPVENYWYLKWMNTWELP
eukprot:Nk52_evm19s233 gene=Nk52_evmTU19s233